MAGTMRRDSSDSRRSEGSRPETRRAYIPGAALSKRRNRAAQLAFGSAIAMTPEKRVLVHSETRSGAPASSRSIPETPPSVQLGQPSMQKSSNGRTAAQTMQARRFSADIYRQSEMIRSRGRWAETPAICREYMKR
jgi:hypothetical protein